MSFDFVHNVHELVDEEMETDPVVKFNAHEELLENMKIKFHDPNTSRNEKFQILTLLPTTWTYSEIMNHFQVSNRMISSSKKLQAEKGLMSQPNEKGGKIEYSCRGRWRAS